MRSVRLTDDELRILSEAVQTPEIPAKAPTRPSVDDFEKLEVLRQKLLDALLRIGGTSSTEVGPSAIWSSAR